jgi:cobalt-zinc-cadmium efflux system membrane fusion protein
MISINQKVSKAVPNNAVVKSGDEYFIFVRKTNNGDDYIFKKIKVNIGLKNDSYTEILTDSLYKNVLIEGAYNLSE